jgi:hypothetical protein
MPRRLQPLWVAPDITMGITVRLGCRQRVSPAIRYASEAHRRQRLPLRTGHAMQGHHRLDNPGTDPADDAFNRWPFSKRLADTIAAFDTSNGAPIFGIFGKWGYGKSTVLNYVKRELTSTYPHEVLLFEFNPWLFKNQEELLSEFFLGLAARMEESVGSPMKETGQLMQKYSGLFGMIPIVGSAASKLAEQVGRELSAETLTTTRDRVFDMMREAKRVIVVLIDDLDRLDHDEILLMLKLVRLNANFPHVVYVIAFDDDIVSKAAGEKYGIGLLAGRQFLEKIVQYPYTLPAVGHDRLIAFANERVRDACAAASVDLIAADWSRFRQVMDLHLSRRLSTPRQAIRYGNALSFALPMLKGHANAFEQVLIEGLRILFPELYTLLRDDVVSFTKRVNDDSFREVISDALSKAAAEVMKGASQGEMEAGISILRELFSASDRPDSVAYTHYFDRYFSYALEPGDIVDAELNVVIEKIRQRADGFTVYDDGQAVAVLSRLAAPSPTRLIDALYALSAKLGPQGASVMAQALARNGSLFTPDSEILLWRKLPLVESELAFRVKSLIIHLISEVPFHADRRQLVMDNILSNAQPLSFAIFLMHQMLVLLSGEQFWQGAETNDQGKQEMIAKARNRIIERIRAFVESTQSAFFEQDSIGPYILAEWNALEPDFQRKWLEERLVWSTHDAVRIVGLFRNPPLAEYNISDIVSTIALTNALDKEADLLSSYNYYNYDYKNDHDRDYLRYVGDPRGAIAQMKGFIARHKAKPE